jgi:hypothetical protein
MLPTEKFEGRPLGRATSFRVQLADIGYTSYRSDGRHFGLNGFFRGVQTLSSLRQVRRTISKHLPRFDDGKSSDLVKVPLVERSHLAAAL